MRDYFANGKISMAHAVFLFAGKFGKRFTRTVGYKKRVIAKAVFTFEFGYYTPV
jgi:hypothetical protein